MGCKHNLRMVGSGKQIPSSDPYGMATRLSTRNLLIQSCEGSEDPTQERQRPKGRDWSSR